MDKSGGLQKMIQERGGALSVGTVSVSLVRLINESTREKEGGQFVHVDGSRLPW